MLTSSASIFVKDCSTPSGAYNTNSTSCDMWPQIGDHGVYIGDPPVNPSSTKWIPQIRPPQITTLYERVNEEFHKSRIDQAPRSEFRTKIDLADRLVFSLDVPGVKKGGVSVTIRGGALTVTAKRADVDNHIYTVCAEVPREFSVVPSDIEAWHEDGVINVAFVKVHNGTVDIAVD